MKNPNKTSQCTKIGQCKNRYGKQIALTHALEKMDNRKVSQMGMMVEKKEELVGHERTKQKAKLK